MFGNFIMGRVGSGGSRSSDFDLTTLDFAIDYAVAGSRWEDIAATDPAAVHGNAMRRVDNIGTLGGNGQSPDAASAATYQTDGTKHWALHDGAADYFNFGDMGDPGTESFFYTIGFRADAWGADRALFAKSLAGGANSRFALYGDGTNITSLFVTPGGVVAIKTAAFSSTSDAVVTAIVDRTAGTHRLRINGVNQGADATFTPEAGNMNTTYPMLSGAYNDGSGGVPPIWLWNGRIYAQGFNIGAIDNAIVTGAERRVAGRAGVSI